MVLPFGLLAAQRCPVLDEIALALAAEFRAVDAELALSRLDDLGAELAGHRSGCPRTEAQACRELLGTAAGFRATRSPAPDHLMLDSALEQTVCHPVVLAIIYAEVARRAGIALCTVGARGVCLLAHTAADQPVVLDPCRGGVTLSDDEIPGGLRWLCPHEAAFAVLGALVGAYATRGDLQRARHAARLRLALPLEARLRERVKLEILGLDAHLN